MLALATAACGSSTVPTPTPSPTPSPATRATIVLAIVPDTLVASPSTDHSFQFQYTVAVAVRETAGLAANVASIDLVLRDAATGAIVDSSHYSTADIQARAGTNFVPAKGALILPNITGFYTLAGGNRRAVLSGATVVVDANGNVLAATAQSTIN
jgi:hypothetical protein